MSDPRTPAEFVEVQTPTDGVRMLAEGLSQTVGCARALVEANRVVDLEGLDGQIGLLCAKALDLPPDEGRRLRPRLVALSGAMEALSRALVAHAPSDC